MGAPLKSRGRLGGAFVLLMTLGTFSYALGANPPIDYPRLLISDTQQFLPNGVTPGFIFADQEILLATNLITQNFQSGMFFSGAGGRNLPTSPVSYLRVAAILLDSIAANKARLSSIQSLLDVKLDASKAAAVLMAQADDYRSIDDDAGAFMIIEQCNDYFSFTDRFWKQVQRQQGLGT